MIKHTILLTLFALVFLAAPTLSFGATKAECTYKDEDASKQACIDTDSLITSSTKPTLIGEAKGIRTIYLSIRDQNGKLISNRSASVRNGQWEEKVAKTLKKGVYAVSLYSSSSRKGTPLATETLAIGTTTLGGTLSASGVPLLFGGAVARGGKAPVAYIQIRNTGKASTTIEGFTLTQNGTTKGSDIIGFLTSDDKGSSQTIVGGIEGKSPFMDKTVFVPLKATIAPGQMRIYSLLALVGSKASIGSTLKLDVTSITSSAKILGTFPIRGTTLTVK